MREKIFLSDLTNSFFFISKFQIVISFLSLKNIDVNVLSHILKSRETNFLSDLTKIQILALPIFFSLVISNNNLLY